MTKPYVT